MLDSIGVRFTAGLSLTQGGRGVWEPPQATTPSPSRLLGRLPGYFQSVRSGQTIQARYPGSGHCVPELEPDSELTRTMTSWFHSS